VPDEEWHWAEAQALLDRVPPEAPHREAARRRYDRRAVRFGIGVLATAVAVGLVVLAVDPPPDNGNPPTWRVFMGLSVGGLGLALLGVRLARPYGSRLWLAEPLRPLTRRQRAELLRYVRGRSPVPPERMALARLQAEALLEQRTRLAPQAGLAVVYLGMWTVHRSLFTTVMALAFTALVGTAGVRVVRDAARARRFLDEHPDPRGRPPTY
jgi:hypothetical protein